VIEKIKKKEGEVAQSAWCTIHLAGSADAAQDLTNDAFKGRMEVKW
jgi:hypothetical protein